MSLNILQFSFGRPESSEILISPVLIILIHKYEMIGNVNK